MAIIFLYLEFYLALLFIIILELILELSYLRDWYGTPESRVQGLQQREYPHSSSAKQIKPFLVALNRQ